MVRGTGAAARLPPVTTTLALDERTIALVRVAAGIARGDAERLRLFLRGARVAAVPPQWIDELLLQSFLNVGYPLALVACSVWRELAGPVADGGEPLAHADWETWSRRGADACGQVYGDRYDRLLGNLRALHPAIEPLVLVDAYGKILGRPGLSLKLRELCTLAAVATLDAPRQIRAHLQGARNVGWTREEIDLALVIVEEQISTAQAREVWEQWAEVRGE